MAWSIALYLLTLLRLPPEHARGFMLYVLPVAFALLWITSGRDMKRIFHPVTTRIDALEEGTLDDRDALVGFRAASNLPRKAFLHGVGWWLLGALVDVVWTDKGILSGLECHGLVYRVSFAAFSLIFAERTRVTLLLHCNLKYQHLQALQCLKRN